MKYSATLWQFAYFIDPSMQTIPTHIDLEVSLKSHIVSHVCVWSLLQTGFQGLFSIGQDSSMVCVCIPFQRDEYVSCQP